MQKVTNSKRIAHLGKWSRASFQATFAALNLSRVADGLIYPLQRIGLEQFRVYDYRFPRSVQIFQYVIQSRGSIGTAPVNCLAFRKKLGKTLRGDNDEDHTEP